MWMDGWMDVYLNNILKCEFQWDLKIHKLTCLNLLKFGARSITLSFHYDYNL